MTSYWLSRCCIGAQLKIHCAAYNGGWGAELHREIVSCRACMRAVYMSSESGAKNQGREHSLSALGLFRRYLFPLMK